MRYRVVGCFVLCSCNCALWKPKESDNENAQKNYCMQLKSLQAVPSCDGELVGQGVVIGDGPCLLGQAEDGRIRLYVPIVPEYYFSFSDAQALVEEGRVCLAPDAKDFGIPMEGYPGIVFIPPVFFLHCDSPYCLDPEGFPDWRYEPEASNNNKHSQHMQQTSSNLQPPSPH